MPKPFTRPRILIVTPEAAFVPGAMVNRPHCQCSLQGIYTALLSNLINDLCEKGVDVHVAQPDYRRIFADLALKKRNLANSGLPPDRLHLAEDRVFFYSKPIDANSDWENTDIALNFQREISHEILPRVQPDLIHCHDWMTGLIPAMAKQRAISCLFSVYNFRSAGSLLAGIEDRGIDAAAIWQDLYYYRFPGNYEETRHSNPLDFLLSGILSAQHISTVSTRHLAKTAGYRPGSFKGRLMLLLQQRRQTGCVSELPHTGIPSDNYNRQRNEESNGNQGAMVRNRHLPASRCMDQPDHEAVIQQGAVKCYLGLYEQILKLPLISPAPISAGEIKKNGRQKATNGLMLHESKGRGVDSHAPFGRGRTSPAIAS